MSFNLERVRKLNNFEIQEGDIVYWISRDQRVKDNWALIFAHQLAVQYDRALVVVFCLQKEFLNAQSRQFDFMIANFDQLKIDLKSLNIDLVIADQKPESFLPEFVHKHKIAALVSDFSPLKIKKSWTKQVLDKVSVPFFEVDAHNIIPVWTASQKQEFGAYTIRPKIHKLLPVFLTEFPVLKPLSKKFQKSTDLEIKIPTPKTPVPESGSQQARQKLEVFLDLKLRLYDQNRNDPSLDFLSNLSAYLHFGQISAQRIALEVVKRFPNFPASKADLNLSSDQLSANAFLEELVVRKELADNFCFYNPNYDNFEGFHPWAKQTLQEHFGDIREFIYSLEEFENAKTHDDLWNAAQLEMVTTGKMHGFMRMYWAKKILEWTPSPQKALEVAIYLNDKYQLDGRDPNGYTGISWAIGGVHDRAWGERSVFGKIRYMNYNGCKRKFDVARYVAKFNSKNLQNTQSLEL